MTKGQNKCVCGVMWLAGEKTRIQSRIDTRPGTATILVQPGGRTISAPAGRTLAEALSPVVWLDLPCGGNGTCGRCIVKAEGQLEPPGSSEAKRLGRAALDAGFRLACQAVVRGDVAVTLQEAVTGCVNGSAGAEPGGKVASGMDAMTLLTGGKPYRYHPRSRRIMVSIHPPSLHSQKDALTRLSESLGAAGVKGVTYALDVVRELSRLLGGRGGDVSVTSVGRRVISIEGAYPDGACPDAAHPEAGPEDHRRGTGKRGGPFGVALDIGTTTLAGYLVDLGVDPSGAGASGVRYAGHAPTVVAASACATNPQVSRGADVVSRITYASCKDGTGPSTSAERVAGMRRLVLDGLNSLIARLASEVGISPREIACAAVAGNTCMTSFFLGVDPRSLGRSPYVPPFRDALAYPAHNVGLEIHPEAEVWVAPGIAGFVGGDSVAVAVVARALDPDGAWLAVDIGTNGEVLLHVNGRLLACSTAAGPAFEGGQITCGMRAGPGAISDVRFEGDAGRPVVTVIGGSAAKGLCGSGLIRAVREMLARGLIEPSGRFNRATVPGGEIELGNDPAGIPIKLTQKDIRQLQLGKAAIRTGIELLMEKAGVDIRDIEELFLAGAFGNHIRPDDAIGIGLLPEVDLSRVKPIGNAAGTGAQLFLLSEESREEALRLSSAAEHVELSTVGSFQDRFVSNIGFPNPPAA